MSLSKNKLPENKPTKKAFWTNVSPGLIINILKYIYSARVKQVMQCLCHPFLSLYSMITLTKLTWPKEFFQIDQKHLRVKTKNGHKFNASMGNLLITSANLHRKKECYFNWVDLVKVQHCFWLAGHVRLAQNAWQFVCMCILCWVRA